MSPPELDFGGKRILVVGDLMLDCYVHGYADRLSPEAPVPVLNCENVELRIGGAGTVARNVVALGGQVSLLSVVGDDGSGREVMRLAGDDCNVIPYIFVENNRITPLKTRYLAGHCQIVRVDHERRMDIGRSVFGDLCRVIEAEMKKCDAVVLSDYCKGVVTGALAKIIIADAVKHKKPVVVDSKSKTLSDFSDATVFTPNLHELAACTGLPVATQENIRDRCREIIGQQGIHNVLATRGRDGVLLQTEMDKTYAYPATATGISDVTGAGDTVVATLALGLAAGMELPEAARLSNIAAGIVVGKVGSATVSIEELSETMARVLRKAAVYEARSATAW